MITPDIPGVNKTYTIYDINGKIDRCVVCPPNMIVLQVQYGEYVVEGESDPHLNRVLAGEIAERPDNPAEVVGNTIINVPVPSIMYLEEEQYTISTPTVELDLPLAGTYRVYLESYPYKDKVVMVVI